MLKTTEPVIIVSKRELEELIDLAVSKAVHEAMTAIGHRTIQSMRHSPLCSQSPVETAGGLLRISQVIAMVGLQKSAIYKRIKEGNFPAPIKLGNHASAWNESSVRAWINGKTDEATHILTG